MIKIIPPFDVIGNREILRYILENNLQMNFSLLQKLYYGYLRPFIPVVVRRILQKQSERNTVYNKDFINDGLVKFIRSVYSDNNFNNLDLYPSAFQSALVLTHDVEGKAGLRFIPKVIELEEKYGFKSSWNIIPYKYKIDSGIIDLIKESGHEVGIHGYNHDGKLYFSEYIFNVRAVHINKALEKYNAVGFRSPMVHRNLQWLQNLNIKYDLSCFDYDPFQPFPGGTGSIWPFIAGKFVELPYTLPQDHTIFFILKQNDISIWKNKIDWLTRNRGVVLTLTHPDYLKERKVFNMYEKLLNYLVQFENLWKCLPVEIAKWWGKKYLASYTFNSSSIGQ